MTDKKKPPSFGDHGKEFLDMFEKETQKLKEERAEQKANKLLHEKKEAELLESMRELKKLDEEVVSETTPEKPIENDRMGKYLKTLRDIDTKQRKTELAEGTVLKETDLLGGADQAVTQAQLKRATGEMFARIQTSLASLGGGGLGKIEQGVEGNPQDGQLPMYDDATGGMVWATVFGVGEAYSDSDALEVILDTVDSAYINARVNASATGGLDSASILNLINDSYVSNQIGFNSTQIALDSDQIVALIEARIDSAADSATSNYGDSDVIDLLNGNAGVQNVMPQADSTYTLGSPTNKWKDLYLSNNSIYMGDNLTMSADGYLGSSYLYVNNEPVFPGALDSAKVTALVDSAYVNVRADHYMTVNHDSDTLVQVDSAYVQARVTLPDLYDTPNHDSDTLVQVDSAYVQLRVKSTDFVAEGVSNLYYETARHDSDTLVQVDSAYVHARQLRTLADLDDTQIDSATVASDDFLRWNGTDWYAAPFNIDPGLEFNGSINATIGGDSAPVSAGGALYVNDTQGVVGPSFTGIAGDSIDAAQAIAYAESDGTWHILGSISQSSVVEIRQGNGISIDDSNPARPFVAVNRTVVDTWYVDSARVEAMIDSEYVNLHSDHYLTADHDSDTLVQVDSAYVQLRVKSTDFVAEGTTNLYYETARHDSDTLIQVDSDYVQARVNFDSAGLDSAQVVSIVDSYVDSFHISNHWRSLENRFVPIIGPSTQTQGLSIADSFQVNRGEMFFGNTRIYINQTEIGDFIVDSSLEIGGTGALQKLEEANGTYIGVGGVFNSSLSIMRSTDYESGVWTQVNASSPDSTGMLYQVKGNGSGDWVAVGHKRQVVYSNDDGLTWQSSSSSATDFGGSDYLFEILWDGSKWSIYGDQGDIMTSTDGSSWTSVTSNLPNTGYIKAAYYDTYNSRYVIGDTSGAIFHTQDATLQTWTQATNVGSSDAWYDIIYDDVRGLWTFFGDNGVVATTDNPNDFTSWTSRVVGGGDNFRQAKSNQYGDILAVGFNNLVVISEDGGQTFSNLTVDLPSGTNIFSVVWHEAEDRWVFGSSSRRLFYQIIQQGQDGLYFDNGDSDLRILTRGDSDFITGLGVTYGDSDVTLFVDSAYVQARLPAGSIVAGGRVVCITASQNHDSSDVVPNRFVKSLFGIGEIDKVSDGVYKFFFDDTLNPSLTDSYSYIVNCTLDYRGDDAGGISGSQRTLNVLRQDSDAFTLVLERGDGDNQDYGSQSDDTGEAIDGAFMNFTVTKAI